MERWPKARSIAVALSGHLFAVKTSADQPKGTSMKVTVGFDGSAASREALRWATDHARQVASRIEVVGAFVVTGGDARTAAGARTEAMLDQALADHTEHIDRQAREGDPVEVLLRCSESSDLLVVGSSRRRSTWHGATDSQLNGLGG